MNTPPPLSQVNTHDQSYNMKSEHLLQSDHYAGSHLQMHNPSPELRTQFYYL